MSVVVLAESSESSAGLSAGSGHLSRQRWSASHQGRCSSKSAELYHVHWRKRTLKNWSHCTYKVLLRWSCFKRWWILFWTYWFSLSLTRTFFVGSSSVKTVADRHRLAAYHNKHCWRAFRGYQHRWPWM